MKKIMFQGTASSVGKTMINAGIGRALTRQGLTPCPFKSQNMSSHSFVTEQGKEMSHSQALQAKACHLTPDVRMNPILLKPVSHMGSEVFFLGESQGIIQAREYYQMKSSLRSGMLAAYDELQKEYGCMLIEGAGSPAEINLREGDFVNMGLARELKAPVILIGDIDRGGVFASLLGTQLLLDEEDRQLIKAFIINKFRGDKSLLMPGVEEIERRMNLPCLGVVPFVESLDEGTDEEIERWADVLEEHLDIQRIRDIAGC